MLSKRKTSAHTDHPSYLLDTLVGLVWNSLYLLNSFSSSWHRFKKALERVLIAWASFCRFLCCTSMSLVMFTKPVSIILSWYKRSNITNLTVNTRRDPHFHGAASEYWAWQLKFVTELHYQPTCSHTVVSHNWSIAHLPSLLLKVNFTFNGRIIYERFLDKL